MPDSYITKKALSSAMKELMMDCPMEKIKINDIVERCNMNRQSFYYHFKDKYDLVNWIFYTEFIADIVDSPEKAGWELIEKMCEFFYNNKKFYTNALKVRGQNSFSEYFVEVIHPIIHTQISDYIIDESNYDFYATFYADAIRVAITRWLIGGTKESPPEFVKLLKMAIISMSYKVINEIDEI